MQVYETGTWSPTLFGITMAGSQTMHATNNSGNCIRAGQVVVAVAYVVWSAIDPNATGVHTEVVGTAAAFKTSVGAEIRFFMPVLNVPFRLIYAWNPSRTGVLDNQLQPAKDKVFRFAVGTTF